METDRRERTAERMKKAEKDFTFDLPLLVDETARDEKILNAITAIEKDQLESIFYPSLSPTLQSPYHQIRVALLQ